MRASLPMIEWKKAVALLERAANAQHNELTGAERKILGDELMGLADKLREVTGMKSRQGER